MSISLRKVGIVGVGHVGAHCAFSLATQGIVDELTLVDKEEQKAVSERQDLVDSLAYLPHRVRVDVGTYEDLRDCDIVVVSAGSITQDQNRLSELQRSVDTVRSFVPQIVSAGFSGIFINITNPCDIVAQEVFKLSGFPQSRVFGTGTGLDSCRFRSVLARETGYAPQSIVAYTLGEHGDSQMAAWSHVSFFGKPLSELQREEPERFTFDRESLLREVKGAGWVTYAGKGATEFGIASTLARFVQCIFRDEKLILPASTFLTGQYGEEGVFASLPCVIGREGVEAVLPLDLDSQETEAFRRSCAVIREHRNQVR